MATKINDSIWVILTNRDMIFAAGPTQREAVVAAVRKRQNAPGMADDATMEYMWKNMIEAGYKCVKSSVTLSYEPSTVMEDQLSLLSSLSVYQHYDP